MPGYFYNGVCFASLSQATDAFFGQVANQGAAVSGTVNMYLYHRKTGGIWKGYIEKQTCGASSCTTSGMGVVNLPLPQFAECDLSTSSDTSIVVWGFTLCLLAAVGLKMFQRATL